MSPQQKVIAWRRMVDDGKSIGDISVRFGVSETIVHRRLALARLSPALWTAYEADEMTLEVLQAFTLTADHATQERVWGQLPPWDRDKPGTVRHILLKEEIPATDKRVRFVGLDTYYAKKTPPSWPRTNRLQRRNLLRTNPPPTSRKPPTPPSWWNR